jgi:hypothetical protein
MFSATRRRGNRFSSVNPGSARLHNPRPHFDDLRALELNIMNHYRRGEWEITKEVLDEADKVLRALPAPPESEQLQEFTTLEGRLDWNEERTSWWAAYTLAPPIAVLIVAASLLWALRGARQTPP